MRYIETLLSSVVIVAVIQWLRGYRTDKNQYITGERKEWRNNIREIAQKMAGADMKEIPAILDGLRVNLNSHGCYQGDYPPKEFLDYVKDEHIWREIDNLESTIREEKCAEAEQQKKRLIIYLSLLLKFDWERSKKEVKIESHVIMSIVTFVCSLVLWLLSIHTPQWIVNNPYECIIEVMGFITMYILAWIPYIIFDSKALRLLKWYKSLIPYIISGSVIFILVWMFVCDLKGNCIPAVISTVSILISSIGILVHLFRYNFYKEYDEKISRLLSEDSLILYGKYALAFPAKVIFFFKNYNINICRQEKLPKEFDSDVFIEEIWDKHTPAKKQAYKILGKKEYLKCLWRKMIERDCEHYDWKEWIRRNPEKCKKIVEYRRGEKRYYTVGKDEKKWKTWIELFCESDDASLGKWNDVEQRWEK